MIASQRTTCKPASKPTTQPGVTSLAVRLFNSSAGEMNGCIKCCCGEKFNRYQSYYLLKSYTSKRAKTTTKMKCLNTNSYLYKIILHNGRKKYLTVGRDTVIAE